VTEDNADVLQQFDLTGHVRPGPSEVAVEVRGETGLLCQAVGRHSEPHRAGPEERPVPEVATGCGRARPSTAGALRARAAVKYAGRGAGVRGERGPVVKPLLPAAEAWDAKPG
jgi:hypothetical protein